MLRKIEEMCFSFQRRDKVDMDIILMQNQTKLDTVEKDWVNEQLRQILNISS